MNHNLWGDFQSRLQASGTQYEDIENCSPSVFQNILSELGFSALDSAKIQTEWARRSGTGYGGSGGGQTIKIGQVGSVPNNKNISSIQGNGGGNPSLRISVPPGSREFSDITALINELIQDAVSVNKLERIQNPTMEQRFRETQAKLCNPNASVVQLFRILPAGTTQSQGAARTAVQHPVSDSFFPTGYVMREGLDSRLISELAAAEARGEALELVLYDVALGRPKQITEIEGQTLSTSYTTEKLHHWLNLSGYDSLQLSVRGANIPVLLNPLQCLPQYVATLAPAAAANGGNSRSVPNSGLNVSAVPPLGGGQGGGGQLTRAASTNSTALVTTSDQMLCPKYGKPLEFWCVDEMKLVCSHCMYKDGYAKKNCVLVEEAAASEADWVARWASNGEQFIGDLGKVLTAFDAANNDIDQALQRDTTTLQSATAELHRRIDNLSRAAEQEIIHSARAQKEALHHTLQQVLGLQSQVNKTVTNSRNALRTRNAFEILKARQAAVHEWPPVRVPAYTIPQLSIDAHEIAREIEKRVLVSQVEGTVLLPESIDVGELAHIVDDAVVGPGQ